MIDHLSPKQVARALGVSEASVKRWCDKGIFETTKTIGGHRRVAASSVISYLRSSGQTPALPQVLGLPELPTRRDSGLENAPHLLQTALEDANEQDARSVAFGLYLSGVDLPSLFDLGMAPAYHAIGECWSKGSLEVYQERRACEIGTRLLHELRAVISPPLDAAPIAFGGTFEHDPYSLATTMIELTLRELGWRAESYGIGLPAETLRAAVLRERPRLLWLSVSHVENDDKFVDDYMSVYDAARSRDVAVAVGGQALTEELWERLRFTSRGDSMSQLADFARALYTRAPDDQPARG